MKKQYACLVTDPDYIIEMAITQINDLRAMSYNAKDIDSHDAQLILASIINNLKQLQIQKEEELNSESHMDRPPGDLNLNEVRARLMRYEFPEWGAKK